MGDRALRADAGEKLAGFLRALLSEVRHAVERDGRDVVTRADVEAAAAAVARGAAAAESDPLPSPPRASRPRPCPAAAPGCQH